MSEKGVVWVHRIGDTMASYRYRAQVPCEEVAKHNGFRTAINDGEADIVVFSKPLAQDVDIAKKAKSDGAKIVFDICDDHFADIQRDTYMELSALSDALVTGTNVMRARIYDYIKRDSYVIGDPYEQEECAPHAEDDNVFLWFGHHRNLKEITEVGHIIGERKLIIATGPKAPNEKMLIWGPEALKKALRESNIVLLPTQKGAEYKTPNRLLNAIRAGVFPVCMTHPAYLEFKHLCWVGHFPTGLRWVDAFRGTGLLNELVKEAQDYIRDRYSPAAIGSQWARFLEAL